MERLQKPFESQYGVKLKLRLVTVYDKMRQWVTLSLSLSDWWIVTFREIYVMSSINFV